MQRPLPSRARILFALAVALGPALAATPAAGASWPDAATPPPAEPAQPEPAKPAEDSESGEPSPPAAGSESPTDGAANRLQPAEPGLVPRLRVDPLFRPRPASGARARLYPTTTPGPEPLTGRVLWDIAFLLGGAFGGADLVEGIFTDGRHETLTTGAGAIFALGTGYAAVRRDAFSVWLCIEAGVKTWLIGDGTNVVQLTRYPLVAKVSFVAGAQGSPQLLLSAGIPYEIDVHMTGKGMGARFATQFEDAIGWMVEIGIVQRVAVAAIDLALRYSNLRYASDRLLGGSADASSIGILLGMHFSLMLEEQRK